MNNYKWTSHLFQFSTVVIICFAIYSCEADERRLKAKCIEAKGTWARVDGVTTCQIR